MTVPSPGRPDSPPPPQTISWNLTKLCNLACAHCYLDAETRKGVTRDELETEACLEIIDQIQAASPEAFLILTGGEPLVRRDIHQLCRYASDKGLWVVLGTNGTLLEQSEALRLKEAGVKGLGISIDSLSAASHDRFRGRPGAWDKAVRGIDAALSAGIDTAVHVSLGPWNLEELPALVDWAYEKRARAINIYFLVCTGRGQNQTGLTPEVTEQVYHRLHELQCSYQGRMLVNAKCAPQYQRVLHQLDPDSPHLHTFKEGCPAATHYCRIDPTGEVTPCPYLPISGGNLKEQPLLDIWEGSEVFTRLRRRGELEGRCGVCEYRDLCSGCRARGLADLGNMMAEDPSCIHQPDPAAEKLILPPGATYSAPEKEGPAVVWDQAALDVLQRIPPPIRKMVRRRMEESALNNGIRVITKEMLHEAREKRMSLMGKFGAPPGQDSKIQP